MDMLLHWLVPDNFMPHGHCYLWTPSLLWLYVGADSMIALSYFTIPVALMYFIKKRGDLQFNWIFMMFAMFIAACGTTHIIAIFTIWEPVYWLDAGVKAWTGIISGLTAIMLWRLMPAALAIPSTVQLREAVEKLQDEVTHRRNAERALAEVNEKLESMVAQRTLELTETNQQLITEIEFRKQTEYDLYHEKQRALVTLESIGDGVITTDTQSMVTYLNPVAERMTGWSKRDASGRPILEVFRIINESTRKLAPNPVEIVMAHRQICGLANHSVLLSNDGNEYAVEDSAAPIMDSDGTMMGVVLVFHDVSDARKMAHRMTYLAEHDFLTDLPNRLLLTDRLRQALHSAKRNGTNLALMFVDIDHFKNINDTLGHEIGDQLLKQIASTLSNCLRNTDTISRQGGDEFIILLPDIADDYAPADIAGKLLDVCSTLYMVGDSELSVTASIGIAVYPNDGNTADLLIKNADTAMYYAKSAGRNNFQFFTQEMTQRVTEQMALENSLRKAISNNELVLHYQPMLSISTGEIQGVEALIRWNHPEWGLIGPDRFIPVAEAGGLINSIGNWVLRQACRQNRIWQDMGLPPIRVSINLSVLQFRQPDFLQEITQILLQSGMTPNYLILEVTESISLQGQAEVISWLNTLKEMGVSLAVDDFGTGYSSLSYLKRLPVDIIKIDKSFIRDIASDPNDAAIIIAIISMAHSLKLSVTAEGVETSQQLDFLKANGCDCVQGFMFSHPLPAEDLAALLQNSKSDSPKPT
ncbi:MAG TPA: EAL domain-containing protein [Methylophilaceae bacterium]|jgi:diguanylate cyclase (GGDEF)-like protein/PAS domain S-box-containing protein